MPTHFRQLLRCSATILGSKEASLRYSREQKIETTLMQFPHRLILSYIHLPKSACYHEHLQVRECFHDPKETRRKPCRSSRKFLSKSLPRDGPRAKFGMPAHHCSRSKGPNRKVSAHFIRVKDGVSGDNKGQYSHVYMSKLLFLIQKSPSVIQT